MMKNIPVDTLETNEDGIATNVWPNAHTKNEYKKQA